MFMMANLTWLAFSLIHNEVAGVFGLSTSDLSLYFLTLSQPLVFVILSIPIGMLADRKGLVRVAGIGSILITVFAALRVFLITDFMSIFLCQIGLSVGAVFVQNCITYLSVHWFPKKERTLATGVSTVFQLIGMLVGSIMSLLLWSVPLYGQLGYTPALAEGNVAFILEIQTVLCLVFTVLFFAIARDRPKLPPDVEEVVKKRPSIRQMLKDRSVWIISYGFFCGFGIIIGLTGILEQLLPSLGIPETLGITNPVVITQTLILSLGIIGAFVISAVSDKVQRRKPFLFLALTLGAVTTLVLGISTVALLTYIVAAMLGFFLISVMPVALTTQEELESVGPQLSGASAGMAFEFGNLGGFLVLIIMTFVLAVPASVPGHFSYFYSILFLFVITLIADALVLAIPETGKHEKTKK
jgi:nitrate/nitrite transporter NarK